MRHRSTTAARLALHAVALAAASLCASPALALGLGRLNVQSALGETLKAEIEVTSMTAEEAATLQLRVASADAYRAAGVEYNNVLPSAQVQVVRQPDGRTVLRISSSRAVLEPFVDVIIEAAWSSGRLVREYTMLFDPPGTRTAQQAPAPAGTTASPVLTPSPMPSVPLPSATPAPPVAAATPAPRQSPRLPPPEPPRPPIASSASPTPAPSSGAPGAGGDEYRVRPGDSLSRIAGRTQRPGVSLDQMLVSLFRGNPQAFSGDNMNRLKSGVVLAVPSAEQAAKVPQPEARDIIVAQSNDFAAYRQRLAGGATTAAVDDTPARQARGQVQAQVDDRKQATAATPDRLTLAQGGAKASAAAAQASKATENRDSKARLAELARNVDELKRLQSAGAPAAAPAPATPPAVAAAPKAAPPAAAPAPAPAAAPVAAPPAATIAPTVVATAPPAPPVAAPTPAPPPPVVDTPAPKPTAAKPPSPSPAREAPGAMDSLLDNSLLLPAAGVLVALLVGLGLYRLRSRMRRPAGETSFLESRLQPDSFFGASGGQRIDTRDAAVSTNSGNSSSMSYSLSQLDAIGDVDPVAEADVYLAYGRDLQAEEILKEAMRATPERMAIRSKLLEVYAKRRDAKAFELLASQMFNLTHGEGDDWAKAQALGLSIDPENPLYQPGGQPGEVRGAGGQVVGDALGASTVPYTAPVNPPTFQPAPDATLDAGALDLDLELDMPASKPGPAAAPAPYVPVTEATMPFSTNAQMRGDDATVDLHHGDGKTVPGQRKPQPADDVLDFDLEALGAEQPTIAVPKPQADPSLDFGDFAIGGEKLTAPDAADGDDPLARKVELAEEFRQIGDLEGARDLLEEVLAKGDGPLKAKAQGMLDKLDR